MSETKQQNGVPTGRYQVGDILCDFGTGFISKAGAQETLSELSGKLLWAFVRAGNDVVSNDVLRTETWDGNLVGEDALKQRIKILRGQFAALAPDQKIIETVRGRGYRLMPTVKPMPAFSAKASVGKKAARVAAYLVGSLLVFAFLTGLYENLYTPYRLKNTHVQILPVSFTGQNEAAFTDIIERELTNAMVAHSGLAVLVKGREQVADFEIKLELRQEGLVHKGRAFVIRRADQEIEGLYVFEMPRDMSSSDLQTKLKAVAENVATVIRGFPNPE